MAYADDRGAMGGFQGDSPLAIFHPELWLADWQEYMEAELVLGAIPPVETLNDESFLYEIHTPPGSDSGKKFPAVYQFGAQVPSITVSEITTGSGFITGRAFKTMVSPRGQNSFNGVSRIKKHMLNWCGDWIEKKVYQDITGDTLSSGTSTVTWADSGVFDTFLDTNMNGGYCSSGGTTDMICIGQVDGYEWDANNGDPIDDFTRIAMIMKNQMKVQGTSDTTITMNPSTSVALLDSISMGALYRYLRDDGIYYDKVGLDAITVPSLFGLTFRPADRGLPTGTVDIGNVSTGYGLCLMYDTTDVPFKGYQYFLDNWHGWSRGGTVSGWDFMTKSQFVPEGEGEFEANMHLSINNKVWYPKKLVLYGGFRSAESI